ncbi:WG repeat-containing protein [Roseivirga sp.]|uniref:WG repeat-containing protein n=1 Tax=Roseivirga sp. TaxID=1964215 RepID=UPI003B5230A2
MRFSKFTILLIILLNTVSLLADQYEPFMEDGRVGLKNITTNSIVIPASYQAIGWSDKSFSVINGVVGALQNEKWAIIDTEGHRITDQLFSTLIPHSGGSFIASKRENRSIFTYFGLIDSRGKTIIPFDYSSITDHPAGLIVSSKTGNQYKTGFLTNKGTERIQVAYKKIIPLNERHLAVSNFKNQFSIFNIEGDSLTGFQYEYVKPYNDSHYLIGQYNHQGLLGKNMELIIPPLYKSLEFESNQITATPYLQWDLYSENQYEGTLYFDDLGFLNNDRFVSSAGGKTGIVTINNNYSLFLSNEELVDYNHELLVTRDKDSDRYHVYNSDGKSLFRDSFQQVELFEQVFFAMTSQPDGHSWAVYNFNGKKLNLFNYESFHQRSPSLFEAKRNGKIGLIASNGKELSPFLYDYLGNYINGRAIAYYNNSYGVQNEQGIWIMTPYYDSLHIMNEHIYFEQGSESGLADMYGKVVYRTQNTFQTKGSSLVQMNEDSTFSLYSLNGDILLEHTYDSIHEINNDLLLLSRDSLQFMYRPSDGFDTKLDSDIEFMGDFENGYIPVKKGGQWGYLNSKGLLAIANRYEEVSKFSEGYFGVKLIGKWGFVNENEELAIQPNYDLVEPFQNGLAIVMNNDKYGIINTNAEPVVKIDYDLIEKTGDYFLLTSNGQTGLIDGKGRIIKNPSYNSISPLQDGFFLVERDGLFGVINLSGDDILPTSYEQIKQSGSSFIGAKKGETRVFELK